MKNEVNCERFLARPDSIQYVRSTNVVCKVIFTNEISKYKDRNVLSFAELSNYNFSEQIE